MPDTMRMLYLPDVLSDWPWPRAINPHYEGIKGDSNAWFRGFKAFTPGSQYAFEKCDFARLAALAYPHATKEHLRTGCDLMNLFFLIDEYTDVEAGPVVREMVDVVIDAMNNPHKARPEGEIILGEVARQFWALAIQTASATSQHHMLESFTAYLESVVQQAEDRDCDIHLSISSYLECRRQNIGSRPSFVILELGLNLSDEVLYHPVMTELSVYISDMLICDNDILSYNKEQAVGDDRHNILTISMRELGVDLEGAIDWVVKYIAELKKKFLDGLNRVPSWGPDMDRQVQEYLYGVACWPRADNCWAFEGGRYFGNKGLEYQRTRLVPLLPKVESPRQNPTLRRENVVIPLIEALEA